MGIFKAIVDELKKPSSAKKGESFENYVQDVLFPSDKYILKGRTNSWNDNTKRYEEDSLLPDFRFYDKEEKREFYVEVKYREGVYNHRNKIEWCNKSQLKRYKNADKQLKTFLAFGIGNPKKPEEIFIIPMSSINYCEFYDSFLDKYSFPYLDKPVYSSYLWKLK